MDPADTLETRDTRGFVMRKGYTRRLERRRRPDAPKETCGRNSFSRRAGGHRDVLRCGMCKPGRHQGDGGKKALKKVGGRNSNAARQSWLALLQEARVGQPDFCLGSASAVAKMNKQVVNHSSNQADSSVVVDPLGTKFKEVVLGDFCQQIVSSVPPPPCVAVPTVCRAACRCHRGVSTGTDANFVAPRRTSDVKSSRSQRVSLSRPSLGQQQGGSENAAPEKPQTSIMSTAVLGDATNRFCTGQWAPIAPEPAKAQPMPTPPCFVQTFAMPISEGLVEDFSVRSDNAQNVAEYEQDIFAVLRRGETLSLPSPTYMDRQVYMNTKMRAILIDWLVDVHKKYKLRPETLFLAVQLIDRYLEIQVTAQSQLQLVGATALMIAAKFEEIHPPQIKEFVYVTDKAYSRDDIQKMEVCILKALQFKICCPTAMHFLEKYQSVNGCTETHSDLAQYLLELTLVDYKMLKHAPSHLAAASILLSNKLLRRPSWTLAAVQQTQMTEPMLKDCAKEICVLLESAETNSLQAVRRKFSQSKYHSVAKLNFMAGPGVQSAAAASLARRRSSTGGAVETVIVSSGSPVADEDAEPEWEIL